MSNMELIINKEEFKKVIEKNNQALLKAGVKLYPVKKVDGTANFIVCTYTYRTSTNARTGTTTYGLELVLNANHGKGRSITIQFRLTKSQAEYILNKSVKDLFNGDKLNFKTRFVYGFRKNGSPYVSCIIMFGTNVESVLLNTYQEEIFFTKMSNLETSYDIYLEEKLASDSIAYDDVEDNEDIEPLLVD